MKIQLDDYEYQKAIEIVEGYLADIHSNCDCKDCEVEEIPSAVNIVDSLVDFLLN